jgi:hypothetical protein
MAVTPHDIATVAPPLTSSVALPKYRPVLRLIGVNVVKPRAVLPT